MTKVAGLCVVRDAIDLIPAICGHYLRLGFDRLAFLDDRSTDGTFEFLQQLGRVDRRISVERVEPGPEGQGVLMTLCANRLISEGYDIFFPFDSDEFWNINLATVVKLVETRGNCIFYAKFVQFVQDRSVDRCGPLDLLKAVSRAPVLFDRPTDAIEESGTYLTFAKPKVGFKSGTPVTIMFGQHKVTVRSPVHQVKDLEVFHLLLRGAEQIDARSLRGTDMSDTRAERPGGGNHYFSEGRTPEGRQKLWMANSANRLGMLDTPLGQIMLIPDTRLRSVLIAATRFIALRHPILFWKAVAIARRPPHARRW